MLLLRPLNEGACRLGRGDLLLARRDECRHLTSLTERWRAGPRIPPPGTRGHLHTRDPGEGGRPWARRDPGEQIVWSPLRVELAIGASASPHAALTQRSTRARRTQRAHYRTRDTCVTLTVLQRRRCPPGGHIAVESAPVASLVQSDLSIPTLRVPMARGKGRGGDKEGAFLVIGTLHSSCLCGQLRLVRNADARACVSSLTSRCPCACTCCGRVLLPDHRWPHSRRGHLDDR